MSKNKKDKFKIRTDRNGLALKLHKPLSKRIHRLSAQVRADQGIEDAAVKPLTTQQA